MFESHLFVFPGKIQNKFNRWGAVIYSATNLFPNDSSRGWDGTFNGQAAPAGVYVYIVEIEMTDGTKLMKAGDLTLNR